MTLDEIRAAKAKLERDLLARCTEFQRETGVSVMEVRVTHIEFAGFEMSNAQRAVAGLSVMLEDI